MLSDGKDHANASLQDVFLAALEKTSPAERVAFLDAACGVDGERRRKIELLLAHHSDDDFLEHPAIGGQTESGTLAITIPETHGTKIGRYKLLEQIGEGGMGAVYMAEQQEPVQRKVALKIIKVGMDTKQVVARFEAERQALAMMDNPNIAKLLDAGVTQSGRPYFVMELVRGIPITRFCGDKGLSIRERLELFLPVCQAIQHAHQKGVIHRDIKPTNILVTQSGGRPHPMVIDFGVAKAVHQRLTEKTLFTHFGQMVGTPSYMSPEQAEMSIHDLDTRSDVYSLGILLYELLTGTPPFPPERFRTLSYSELQRIIKEEEPVRPSLLMSQSGGQQGTGFGTGREEPVALARYFRGDLDWIVLKAIEKDRERRYETPRALAEDVTRHLNDEPVEARPPTLLYQLQKGWHRNRVLYNAIVMVVSSLLIGIGASSWMAWEANQARQEAELAGARETALRKQTEQEARKQRMISYANDMRTVAALLKKNRITEARTILDRYADDDGIRGYYWDHLDRLIRVDQAETLAHEAMVRSVSMSEDGSRLASQTVSGRVRLYEITADNGGDDTASSHRVRLRHQFGGGVLSHGAQGGSVALSPNGRWLASDQQDTLTVWDSDTGEILLEEPRVIAPMVFTPDSASLIANTGSGLRQWSTEDWSSKPLGDLELATDTSPFCALAFTADGRYLVLCPSRFASTLTIFDMAEGTTVGQLEGLERPSVIATDGNRVVAGGRDGRVCVWELASRSRIASFQAHDNVVLGIAFSPDGRFLATGGSERAIFLWDTETFSRIGRLDGHHSQVWCLEASHSPLLASASMDHSVKLWEWKAAVAIPETAPTPPPAETVTAPAVASSPAPQTHHFAHGADLQAAIDAADPGDRIELAPGTHEVAQTLIIRKPLTIRGTGSAATVLESAGAPRVIHVKSDSGQPTLIEGLQIRSQATAIRHESGLLEIRDCQVSMRSVLEFQGAVSLESRATNTLGQGVDTVKISGCRLAAEYAGDTPEGTPPDVDVILVHAGCRYRKIEVSRCEILNEVPNRIANGLETRSVTADIVLRNNQVRCLGLGFVIPNHVGRFEILDNTIWSASLGIQATIDSPGRNLIRGNTITIDQRELEVFPLIVQDFIATRSSACIQLGCSSAGVTAGFFYQKYLDLATHVLVEKNVFKGNPHDGIALTDSVEPENFGPAVPNRSHDNTITGNDFTSLNAEHDIAFGKSTYDNVVFQNQGIGTVFREAGANDLNRVVLGPGSTWRYVLDEVTSPALENNLLGDLAVRPLWVWLPPSYDTSPNRRYPVIYLLHGFTGDHHSFKARGVIYVGAGELAAALIAEHKMRETILVLVDASNGFGGSMYARNAVIGDYLAYLGRDVVGHIDTTYRTLTTRQDRSLAGNSMGANGTFALAMAYPEVFGAIAAMSPSADYAAAPTVIDRFLAQFPAGMQDPTIVRSRDDRRALLASKTVWVNLLYAQAAAWSPNRDNPPYFVDLPVRYPDKAVVSEVWQRWLEQDLVSRIERDGDRLARTRIFVDIGVGPTTIMPEGKDISHLLQALRNRGLDHVFVQSPGDHLSHLRERTAEALKFLSDPDAYSAPATPLL